MKFNIADIVEHPSYGVGIVVERCMSASGVNELYSVLFNRVLSNNGVKRVFGSDLKFVRHTEPEKEEQKYENSDDDFSKAELRKIEDLRTFFIYISNRPSVLVEVKKS